MLFAAVDGCEAAGFACVENEICTENNATGNYSCECVPNYVRVDGNCTGE